MNTGVVDAAPATLRLFLALWPDPATRDAIASWQRTWTWPERAAPVAPGRLHLTLHFLGPVPAQELSALVAVLKGVPGEGFTLTLGVPEVWSNGVAVLRPESAPAGLLRLHRNLAQCVAAFGLPLDPRPYRPHVTLARRAIGAQPPAAPCLQWEIARAYVLARSLPGGAGYQVLERFG